MYAKVVPMELLLSCYQAALTLKDALRGTIDLNVGSARNETRKAQVESLIEQLKNTIDQ